MLIERGCSSFIQVPLLNLLATVSNRAGGVRIRVGGNTQEYATLVDSLPNQEMTMKGPLVAPAGSNTVGQFARSWVATLTADKDAPLDGGFRTFVRA